MPRRAFTLIELLVVIAIVALLSSVVLASLNSARDKSSIATGVQFAASTQHAIGSEAVLVWTMEEGPGSTVVADLSGNGNVGTITGASWDTDTYSASSKYSLNFDTATVNKVQMNIGTANPELDIAGNVTEMAWIYPLSETMSFQPIMRAGVGANERYSLYFRGTTKSLVFEWYNGSSWVTVGTQGNVVPMGTWSHVAITREGTKVSFYVNGKFISTSTVTAPVYTADIFSVGYINSSQQFLGKIDEVRVYASALSLAKINDVYLAGLENIRLAGNP